MVYAKEENTLSPPTRSADASKAPHRLFLPLEAQHGHNLRLFLLVSYLWAFFIALPPTPPAAALPRLHPGRLLAAAPGRLAHTPRDAASTRALPLPPALAAQPPAAAATAWQVASRSASVR